MIYIDRDGGNDADDGLSPDTAWKNCPGTSAYSGSGSVVAGDTVVFDSNDTWTLTGSPQGLFLVGGVRYVGDEWAADGGSVSGRATLIAGNDFNSNGVVRFRDHPNTETVFKGFEVDVNGMSANGIDINHGFWSLMNGATKRVENVEVHHVYTESSRGEYHYGIAMSNWGGDAGVLENVEILNCSVHDIGRDAIILYPSDDPSSRIGNILVRGCDIYNTGQDPNYGEGHGIVVKGWVYDSTLEFNYVHDVNSSAIFISGPEGNTTQRGADNLRIQHNILTSQDNNGIVRFYKSGDKQVEVVGNIIHNNSQTGGLSLSGNSGALDLVVFNNTFYQTFVDLGGHNSNVNALDLANNIIQYSNNPLRNTSYATSLAANLVTTSDPGFVNSSNLPTGFVFSAGGGLVPNTDGIALGRNCTAVDAGVALGAAYENSINGIPRPQGLEWDVGAYESGHTSSCVALTCNQVAPECGAVSDGCGGTLTCACAPVCGDGSCDIGETCSTCASDCECSSGTTVNASSCSQSSVEQAISQAAVGDTVVVPPGECTWSGFTIDKAIHLKGSGIGATTITRGGVVTVVKQPAGIVRISDFSFVSNGSGNSTLAFRFTGSWQNARPIIFENNDVTTNRSSFISFTMSGGSILANNTWTAGIDDSVLDYIGYSDSSWDEASTMGADDTTGELNHYIEGNTIYGGANQFIDCAGNARCVYRHNDTKYSSFNTHGQHADPAGVRHYEIYENLFRHDQAGADTPEASVIWSLWLRGGTGVVFNNYFDNISGGHWGDHKEIRMTVPVDPNALDFGGSCVGWDYPMPRQIGQSHNGTNTITDPVYFWSNTGTMERSVSIYASEACGLTIDDVFQWGRDAIWEGGAKPGYTAYPYPHPLVGGP